MSIKKIFIAFIVFFTMLGLSGTVSAEAKKKAPEVLKEVDAKIQAALDAIPSGNAEEITTLIRAANETASDLSANYKFEFERDKVMAKLKDAGKLSKKADLTGAEQKLKEAREGFANLKNFL